MGLEPRLVPRAAGPAPPAAVREDGRLSTLRSYRWLLAFGGATIFALLIATQNFMLLREAGRPIAWWTLAVGELPVWYTWLGLVPAIRRLALRFPPVGPHTGRNLALHVAAALLSTLLMIAVVTAVRMQLDGLVPDGYGFLEAVRRGFRSSFIIFLPIYGIILLGVLALNFHQDTQERSLRESRLQAALANARLESLRDRLHPHFLFNTLHAVSALMAEDVPTARKMMRRLSELLRIALEEGKHEVRLEEELSILEMYVDIQKIRFGDRLSVHYEISPDARRFLVPRFLLQPLVENAIKHGIGGRSRTGVVTIRARVREGRLVLAVIDNGPGFPDVDRRGSGIGLANTEARLEQLYGSACSLELGNTQEGGARVVVSVPARESDATEVASR